MNAEIYLDDFDAIQSHVADQIAYLTSQYRGLPGKRSWVSVDQSSRTLDGLREELTKWAAAENTERRLIDGVIIAGLIQAGSQLGVA